MTADTSANGVPTAMPLGELLGITVVRDRPGDAVCRLVLRAEHLNQGLLAHGGVLFSLADTALGLAANQPGEPTWVGTSFSMSLYRGVGVGDAIRATAAVENRSRSLLAYRVRLEREADGKLIGTMGAQLLAAPAVGTAPVELTRTPADRDAPLVRALMAAREREDGTTPRSGDVELVLADGRPIGMVADGSDVWLHPAWRGVVGVDDALGA